MKFQLIILDLLNLSNQFHALRSKHIRFTVPFLSTSQDCRNMQEKTCVPNVLNILDFIQRYRTVFKSVPVPKHSCEIRGTSLLIGSLIFTFHLYFNFSPVLDVTSHLLPQQLYCIIMHSKHFFLVIPNTVQLNHFIVGSCECSKVLRVSRCSFPIKSSCSSAFAP